jgi:LPXTG-motif cell wall-anchored protein
VEVVTPEVSEQQWIVDQAASEGTPAVTQLSHTEEVWAASTPGADWTGPHDSRTVGGSTESTTTTGDDLPAGNGWNKVDTRHVPAVVETVWAQAAPDGYIPTGGIRDLATPEQTDVPSAVAPDGEGWSRIAGSLVVVVDQPATTDLIPGHTEQVEILPAMPSTEPCVEGPETPDTDEPSNSAVAGPQADDAGEGAGTAPVLPATGNAVSPLITAGGLAALLAGSALVRVGRRRQAD